MTSFIAAAIGFALCGYGLTPLSGSNPTVGFVSERGCLACLFGIAILAMVGVVKVLT